MADAAGCSKVVTVAAAENEMVVLGVTTGEMVREEEAVLY